MAALTRDRNTPRREGVTLDVRVKAGAKLFAGSLACADAGWAAPGRTAQNLVALGRVEALADNTGGVNGAISARIRRGVFQWENASGADAVTAAAVGKNCYILDDQTVTITAAGRSVAGKVIAVDSGGVWVETR